MALATLADVALTCLLVAIALRLSASFPRRAAPFLMALDGGAAFGIEVLAQSAGWWRYSAAMPRIEIFGSLLGVLPLLQMAFLPLFAWILSDKERQ